MKLQVVGCGNMGRALLNGVLDQGWAKANEIRVVERDEDARTTIADAFDGVTVSADIDPNLDTLIAVKPQHVATVLGAVTGPVRVLSVAAGVRIQTMQAAAPNARIVRSMPNTPALVGQGASAIAGGQHVQEADLEWAESILGAVGMVVRVDETDLDAVTGLSGSGPAYVFHLAEGLIAAGIAQGLSPETSDQLARQTIMGAATLLSQSNESPATLRRNVTSPGGTTAAGIAVFTEANLTEIIGRVVAAATERSVELAAET